MMQLCPVGQSAEVWQIAWHLPQVHTKEPLQSLFRTHAPPTSIFFAAQPTGSHVETIIRPKMRILDADIPNPPDLASERFLTGAKPSIERPASTHSQTS
jgi:hypothetical protein